MTESARAVFLSYASEDGPAAARLADALQAAGIQVWFDRSALRGGDAWDAAIREQIRACALFIPVISARSNERDEGYFRLEWKLAVDRSHLMAADRSFIVPVTVDGTTSSGARIPDRFRDLQWTTLPNGEATPGFIARIQALLAGVEVTPPAPVASPLPAGGPEPQPVPTAGSRRRWLLVAAMAGLCLAIGAAFLVARPRSVASTAPPSNPAIAVLAFTDLSAQHDQEYFADGLAEELIDLLTQDSSIKVAARTSSFYFKGRQATIGEIAKTLGVTHVLEGSVRMAGNRLRIAAQLVRGADGFHVWSGTFERPMNDVLQVQDEIAGAVAAALRTKLRVADARGALSNGDAAAHDAVLRASALIRNSSPESAYRARGVLDEAIAANPTYAPAWAARAAVNRWLGSFADDTPGLSMPAARSDARRALELDPANARAHQILAAVALFYDFDPVLARSEAEEAVRLGAESNTTTFGLDLWTGCVVDRCYADLLHSMNAAVDRDPLSSGVFESRATLHYVHGDLPEAERDARKALELAPDNGYARYLLVRTLIARHDAAGAVQASMERPPTAPYVRVARALTYAVAGPPAEADTALAGVLAADKMTMSYQLAQIYAVRGDSTRAVEFLESAYRARDSGLWMLKVDPLLASLRADTRVRKLMAQLKMLP